MELINSYKELCDSYKKIKEAYESLLIGNAFSKPKVDIGITCNLIDDDMPCVASSCSTSKASVSTSCDDLLDVPCSSNIEFTSRTNAISVTCFWFVIFLYSLVYVALHFHSSKIKFPLLMNIIINAC